MAQAQPMKLALVLLICFQAVAVSAATFEVTRTDDPVPDSCAVTDCSLREAILDANNLAGPDVILVSASQTYTLALVGTDDQSGDLDVRDDLEIRVVGDGRAVLSADRIDRVFDLHSGLVTMAHLVITGGELNVFQGGGGIRVATGVTFHLSDTDVVGNRSLFQEAGAGGVLNLGTSHFRRVLMGGNQGDSFGGAISNNATMTLEDSILVGNSAANGSAISMSAFSETTLLRTVVTGNTAEFQAALNIQGADGRLHIIDSTLSNNSAGTYPGGVLAASGAEVNVTNSTISGNPAGSDVSAFLIKDAGLILLSATVDAGITGLPALFFEQASTFTSQNNILLDGCAFGLLFSGAITSNGGNLEAPGDSCGLTHSGDQVAVAVADLELRALAPNGGRTGTRVLGAGSLARNSGVGPCVDADQRGFPRYSTSRSVCDSGATTYTPCSQPNLPIPDNDGGGVSDQIVITDNTVISDLDLFVTLQHGRVGDLRLELSHLESGTDLVLMDQPVDADGSSCVSNGLLVVFDDEAVDPIESSCASGDFDAAFPAPSYRPGDPPGPILKALDGIALTGTWQLTVSDLAASETGLLAGWCMIPHGNVLFADGFESADINQWTLAVP